MNGEAGTTGREALLAWKVDRGSFDGVSLNGLAVVAAVAGDTNLGIREIGGGTAQTRTALFVDERATPAQRTALVAMAKQHSNGMRRNGRRADANEYRRRRDHVSRKRTDDDANFKAQASESDDDWRPAMNH